MSHTLLDNQCNINMKYCMVHYTMKYTNSLQYHLSQVVGDALACINNL